MFRTPQPSRRPSIRIAATVAVLLFAGRLRDRALESGGDGVRGALLAAAAATPGLPVSELARRLDLSHNAATYHVRLLAKRGALVLVRRGGARSRLHVYSPGAAPARPLRVAALALAPPLARAVLDALRRAGRAMGAPEVAAALGAPVPGVRFHLGRLEGAGLVRARRGPNRCEYEAVDAGAR